MTLLDQHCILHWCEFLVITTAMLHVMHCWDWLSTAYQTVPISATQPHSRAVSIPCGGSKTAWRQGQPQPSLRDMVQHSMNHIFQTPVWLGLRRGPKLHQVEWGQPKHIVASNSIIDTTNTLATTLDCVCTARLCCYYAGQWEACQFTIINVHFV